MAASIDDFEFLESEDYYAFLNVDREATPEQISNSFRRLSKLFHPDKHADKDAKASALELFNKLQEIYEVLSDPHKRAVYDTLGVKGLETYGKEVVLRSRTPQEIREEYQRLLQLEEERRMQNSVNPKGSLRIHIDATNIFEGYSVDPDETLLPKIDIKSMSIMQSVEAPITHNNTVELQGMLGVENGYGNGSVNVLWRRLTGIHGWWQCQLAVGSPQPSAFSLTHFRTLTTRCHMTASGIVRVLPRGLDFSTNSMLSYQLDRSLVGRIHLNIRPWRRHLSVMKTELVWQNPNNHLEFSLQLSMSNTNIACVYVRKFLEDDAKFKVVARLGVYSSIFEYGIAKKISKYSVLEAYVSVGVPSGVMLKIKLHRGNQDFHFPIQLSDEILPKAIFYGTVVPLVTYFVVKKLIVDPFVQKEKEEDTDKKKEKYADLIAEKRRQAQSAVELMKETVERIREEEERKGGLIIVRAVYGKIISTDSGDFNESQCIDANIPLQVMVKNSSLILPETKSKSEIPGFYDPCMGEEKHLYIRYKFQRKLHEVTIADKEPIRLPLAKHIIRNNTSENS